VENDIKLEDIKEDEQIAIILGLAKEEKWEIHFDSKNKRNFHIITDNNIWLCRKERQTPWSREWYWSLVRKHSNISEDGGYAYIIPKFLEEYNKTHEVIYL
jgi:hypothetical protein